MKRDERFIFSLLSLGLLLYFASSIYFNFQLFNEPFKMIINFPSILENYPAVSYTAKVSPEYYGYQSLASVYSYMQILGSFFIMLIFLVYW